MTRPRARIRAARVFCGAYAAAAAAGALATALTAAAQPAAPATAAPTAPPPAWTVDPTHTTVHADLTGLGPATRRARLERPAATMALDRAARRGTLTLTAPLAALHALAGSPPTGDAAVPAALRFVADAWRFEGERVTAIDGTLEVGARRAPLTWRAVRFACYPSPLFRRAVCGGDFEAEPDAALLGLVQPSAGAPASATAAGDARVSVRLLLQIEALAPAAAGAAP